MRGDPFGQRRGDVVDGAEVGDRPVPIGQLQLGGQRDRPRCLNLDRSPAAPQTRDLPSLFQRIDVLVEQAGRPSRHRAGPGHHPVATRHRVDGDVDQQRTGTPDDVGAHSAGRQLDQVSQRGAELADDNLGGRSRGGTRPRPGAGSGCENTHRPTVFDGVPGAPSQGRSRD